MFFWYRPMPEGPSGMITIDPKFPVSILPQGLVGLWLPLYCPNTPPNSHSLSRIELNHRPVYLLQKTNQLQQSHGVIGLRESAVILEVRLFWKRGLKLSLVVGHSTPSFHWKINNKVKWCACVCVCGCMWRWTFNHETKVWMGQLCKKHREIKEERKSGNISWEIRIAIMRHCRVEYWCSNTF